MNKGKPSKPVSSPKPPKVAGRRRTRRDTEPDPGGEEMRERENASGPRVPKRLSSGSPGRGRRSS